MMYVCFDENTGDKNMTVAIPQIYRTHRQVRDQRSNEQFASEDSDLSMIQRGRACE
jgi:hypothetical protein